MFKVDSFLTKGSSHDICEDYIIHGTEPFPYVILADGCSSSKETDVGARILVYSAKRILGILGTHLARVDYNDFGNRVILRAQMIAESMNLSLRCLDATLMIAFVFDNRWIALCYGDGTFIAKTDEGDGKVHYEQFSFTQNMPYYLSYNIDPATRLQYSEKSEEINNVREVRFTSSLNSRQETEVLRMGDFAMVDTPLAGTTMIAITSDGIESFTNRINGQQIPFEDLIPQVVNFKNTNGRFVKRLMGSKKGVINMYAKNNIHHADDISIGAIIYEDDK